MNKVYTLGQVARLFGIPTWKVRRLFERQLLPEANRIGNYRVVSTADLPQLHAALRTAGYLLNHEGVAHVG